MKNTHSLFPGPTRRPIWAIVNRIRQEKAKAREDALYREVAPGVFIK